MICIQLSNCVNTWYVFWTVEQQFANISSPLLVKISIRSWLLCNWNNFEKPLKFQELNRFVWKRAQVENHSIKGFPSLRLVNFFKQKNMAHYCLQQHAETDTNIVRKKTWEAQTNIYCGGSCLLKTNRRKTTPKLNTEWNSTRQHSILFMTIFRILFSVEIKRCVSIKKLLLKQKENYLKRLQW